jgi:hypothetical protein
MVKKVGFVLLVLAGIFICGMVQEARNRTYEITTVYTPTASYIVVMDTRTSMVRVKEVEQCNDIRFFDENEARLRRYEYNKKDLIVK